MFKPYLTQPYALVRIILCFLLIFSAQSSFAYHNGSRLHGRAYNRSPYQRVAAGSHYSYELRGGTIWVRGAYPIFQGLNSTVDTAGQVGVDNKWINVVTSASHALGLKADGTLWAWGTNSYYELGISSTPFALAPVQVGTNVKWVTISAGYYCSAAIRSDGTLWTSGMNVYGQMGQGYTSFSPTILTQVGTDNKWVSVVAGWHHMMALKSDGTLWVWGNNSFGQLGIGTTGNSSVPVQVGIATNWVSIALGTTYSAAIKADGTLWAWGQNNFGQLGILNNINQASPTQVGSDNAWLDVALDNAGTTIALKANGTLWSWGNNANGMLGDGASAPRNYPLQVGTDNDWTAISVGSEHVLGVKANGEQWGWGNNQRGSIKLGTSNGIISIPILINTVPDGWNTLAHSVNNTIAIKSDGTLWGWGRNHIGQLGSNSITNQLTPLQISGDNRWVQVASAFRNTIALKADGTLWACGGNFSGQLGLGYSSTSPVTTLTQIGTASDWVSVATTDSFSVALKANGTLWAWGSGLLGNGIASIQTSPIQIGTENNWVSVHVAQSYVLALKSNGTLWAWGDTSAGQLGIGPPTSAFIITPTQVGTSNNWLRASVGTANSGGIKSDGTLWMWGDNANNQLGNGGGNNQFSPVQVGNDNSWKEILVASSSCTGIKANGTLWSWGDNYYGQLGMGNWLSQSVPTQVASQSDVVQLATNGTRGWHVAIIKASRDALCLTGANTYGQIGDSTTVNKNSFYCISNVASPPLSTPTISITATPSGAMCLGSAVTFTATITNGGTAPVYQWKVNGTVVATSSPTYTSSTLANGDVITCTVTSNATGVSTPTVTSECDGNGCTGNRYHHIHWHAYAYYYYCCLPKSGLYR